MPKYLLITLLFLFSAKIFSQESTNNGIINGFVISTVDQTSIANAHIKNLRTGKGTTSDKNGFFKIEATNSDSIIISAVSFSARTISNYEIYISAPNTITIEMYPLSFTIEEVEINEHVKTLEDYKSFAFEEEPGFKEAITKPASFIYYKTSKKEKQKKHMRETLQREEQMAHVYKVYNNDLIKEYSGLEGEELEKCIQYCNANIKLDSMDGEQSIKMKLLTILTDYFKENPKE